MLEKEVIATGEWDEKSRTYSRYKIRYRQTLKDGSMSEWVEHEILMQQGIRTEVGLNGIFFDELLEICIQRLKLYQAGELRCRENALALTKLEEAQLWLEKRTADRQKRNVEGTYGA